MKLWLKKSFKFLLNFKFLFNVIFIQQNLNTEGTRCKDMRKENAYDKHINDAVTSELPDIYSHTAPSQLIYTLTKWLYISNI